MKLYHGTTETVARAAFMHGLKPRASTGARGNWDSNPSNPELVYLTAAYAGYFAGCACEEGERWGIVEVDATALPTSFMRPDEDFIEQASRGGESPIPTALKSLERRTQWVRDRLDNFAHHWRDSVEGLGNCAFKGGIQPEAVTGVAIFDPKSNPMVAMAVMDPTITLLNYTFMARKYEAAIRWLMGEDITPEEFGAGFTGIGLTPDQEEAAAAKLPPEMLEAINKRVEVARGELGKREGLTVMRPLEPFSHEPSACCEAPVVAANGLGACSACGRTGEEHMDHPEGG
jgi:hypothetical protein